MKRNFIKLVLVLVSVLVLLTACRSSMSYTYKVETGDAITIKLDTSDGHGMTYSSPYEFSKDNVVVSQGMFITMDTYAQYENAVKNNSLNEVLETGSDNGVEYILYCYNNEQYTYLMKIEGSKTGFLLASATKDDAKETFSKVEFSKQ